MIRVRGRGDTLNNDSILDSVKKARGIVPEDTSFDDSIILYINTVIGKLQQLGVHSDSLFEVNSSEQSWTDYLSGSPVSSIVKTYIAMEVGLMFDPPSSSSAMQAAQDIAKELEWRILVGNESE